MISAARAPNRNSFVRSISANSATPSTLPLWRVELTFRADDGRRAADQSRSTGARAAIAAGAVIAAIGCLVSSSLERARELRVPGSMSEANAMAAAPSERKLTAVVVADVVGYSRLTAADEEGTIARLRELRSEIVDPAVARHRGRIVKTMGDGFLIEFPSVVDAVRSSLEIQQGLGGRKIWGRLVQSACAWESTSAMS